MPPKVDGARGAHRDNTAAGASGHVPRLRGVLVREAARRWRPVLRTVAALGLSAAAGGGALLATSPASAAMAGGAANPVPGAAQAVPAAAGVSAAVLTSIPGAPAMKAPAASASAATETAQVKPLGQLREADVLVVAPTALKPGLAAKIAQLPGVVAAQPLDAATIKVNGRFIQMLGVDPSAFRAFAAGPTARSTALWRSVAGGSIALSYTMGKLDKLALGDSVTVAGHQQQKLRVGAFGTVGIAGADAVVSDRVARSLGIPAGNAIVISAPGTSLAGLTARVKALVPHGAGVAQLVAQAAPGVTGPAQLAAAGAAGAASFTGADGTMTSAQVRAFLTAALSKVGSPYVWGGSGPAVFDCSGLVQWSLRQAGLVMPRVAADQARTGPLIPLSELRPGDLLFYHTDVTAPTYISHVAIYLGNGLMEQAPQPGQDVEVVHADFGSGFAGAVQISPAIAAGVAGNPAG
jgi:peptidoglycan DL-endopeptidase CwlO